MMLLGGAFRSLAPALALSILDPQLNWSEAVTQARVERGVSVMRGDGTALTPYDLNRLKVRRKAAVS